MRCTKIARQVSLASFQLLVLCSLMSGCDNNPVNGNTPDRHVPYIRHLSSSNVDHYIYFVFEGDSIFDNGVYRYEMESDSGPELIIKDALSAAISPCGRRLAYLPLTGEIRMIHLENYDPDQSNFETLVPDTDLPGPVSVQWRGCDNVLYSGEYDSGWGIYQIDVQSHDITFLAPAGREPSSSLNGERISYTDGNLYVLHQQTIDTLTDLDLSISYALHPAISWSGNKVVYVLNSNEAETEYDARVVDLASKESRGIAQWASYPVWTQNDHNLLYVSIDSISLYEIWRTKADGAFHEQVLSYKDFYDD